VLALEVDVSDFPSGSDDEERELPDLDVVAPFVIDGGLTTAELNDAEDDEAGRALDMDPELGLLQDAGYEWETSDWFPDAGAAPARHLRQPAGILPEEDPTRVCANVCKICKDTVTFAMGLACMHMLCANCAADDRIQRCPFCNAVKKVKAMCHVASLDIDRVEDIPFTQVIREAPREQPPENLRQVNLDAIDDVLREGGIEDPVAFRAEQMRAGRRARPRRRHQRRYELPGAATQGRASDSDGSDGDEDNHDAGELPPAPPTIEADGDDPTPEVRRRQAEDAAVRRAAASSSVADDAEDDWDQLTNFDNLEPSVRQRHPSDEVEVGDGGHPGLPSQSLSQSQRVTRRAAAAEAVAQRRLQHGMVSSDPTHGRGSARGRGRGRGMTPTN